MKPATRLLLPTIPYAAVLIGMYALGSAFAAIGLYQLGMLTAVLILRRPKPDTGTHARNPWLYLSTLIFASGGLIFYLLWPYLGQDPAAIGTKLQSYGLSSQVWPFFAVYFCVVNSLTEELFWRGLLGDDSRTLRGNDLMFGGYHALVLLAFTAPIWVIPVFVGCAFAGWLWRMLRALSGGLVMPVITHFVADLGIVAAVHFRVFG